MSADTPSAGISVRNEVESPDLALNDAAMCLHFVEPAAVNAAPSGYPDCPVLRSIELDLLSYSFQEAPPIGSQCETYHRTPVEILFPETIEYLSEGESVALACRRTVVPAAAVVTSTGFLQSGARVWHLVLSPAPGSHFTEFDLIKLIHLYDGRTEGTELYDKVRFRRPESAATNAAGLLRALCPDAGPKAALRSGTIEIITEGQRAGNVALSELFSVVREALEPGRTSSDRKLSTWLETATTQARVLKAYCGIVSGILDHENLDTAEILDTLTPTLPESQAFIRSHRGTLVVVAEADRLKDHCADNVGISPYYLIPHALALYNESLIAEADDATQKALSDPKSSRAALEAAHALADRNLNNLYLPNLFNYSTEQELYERMMRLRGSGVRRVAAVSRMQELSGVISAIWETRREHGQMLIAVLLALLSVIQIKDIVISMAGEGKPVLGWSIFGVVATGICVLIVSFWRMGIRR